MPERLRGETVSFDIKVGDEVIVEAGRRITARHIRQLDKAGVSKLDVTREYMVGRTLAHNVVDKETGELLADANTEITDEMMDLLVEKGVKKIQTIFTNDLDHGPFISDTLRIDSTSNELEAQVEIYRMMRPG